MDEKKVDKEVAKVEEVRELMKRKMEEPDYVRENKEKAKKGMVHAEKIEEEAKNEEKKDKEELQEESKKEVNCSEVNFGINNMKPNSEGRYIVPRRMIDYEEQEEDDDDEFERDGNHPYEYNYDDFLFNRESDSDSIW